jgi:eukaryotic-like serine/threonine-protein kinase
MRSLPSSWFLKEPGAERELLFVQLDEAENVVPILESGETTDDWVIVMPRAEKNLRDELNGAGGRLSMSIAVEVATDILRALSSIDGKIVHRDLKPENVLKLDGRWCLADFGISRYAEATTGLDTRKFALSPPYAAPERWRSEGASTATDMYSLGVIAYEILTGDRPFAGPTTEAFREQHLHEAAPSVPYVPNALAALIEECLYKSPDTRPRPANAAERLSRADTPASSGGLASLEAANRAAVARRGEVERQASQALSEAEQRHSLEEDGRQALGRIGHALRAAILSAAPTVSKQGGEDYGWTLGMPGVTLEFTAPLSSKGAFQKLDVALFAELDLRVFTERHGEYEGRSHSLWFCNHGGGMRYAWYELAFMVTPLMNERSSQNPFALPPDAEAAQAIEPGMGTRQIARQFALIDTGDLDEFIDRWAGWFGQAATGALQAPTRLPES